MSEQNEENPLPPTPTFTTLENLALTYLVLNTRTFAPVRRVLTREQEIGPRIERLGGFERALVDQTTTVPRDRWAVELSSFQNSYMLSQFFGDNIDTIRPLTEFESELEKIKRTVTAIATELANCCEEIKGLLKQLDETVKTESKETRRRIILRLNNLLEEVKNLLKDLHDSLGIKLDNILNILEPLESNLKRDIENAIQQLTETLSSDLQDLKNLYNTLYDTLTTELDALGVAISEGFVTLEVSIEAINTALITIGATVAGIEGTLVAEIPIIRQAISSARTSILARINTLETNLNTSLDAFKDDILTEFDTFKDKIYKDIQELNKDLLKAIDERLENIETKVAEKVCLSVVGESYERWDSISSFYPTLVFVFKEVEVTGVARRSQLKARLFKPINELTDADIETLKTFIQDFREWRYEYGPIRCNYVSPDRRWKSTVFTSSYEEGQAVFERLGFFTGESFDKDYYSVTTAGRKRPKVTKRTTPLAGVGLNTTNYNDVFLMQLYKAVLLINNLREPIVLFPS